MMVTVRARNLLASAIFLCLLAGCSREQQDWRSAESADTMQAYGQFLEHHPDSELATQARTRIGQLGEDRDWLRAGTEGTVEAYRQFLAQHPNGKWSQEARIRVENFALGAAPAPKPTVTAAPAVPASSAPAAAAPIAPAPSAAAPAPAFGIQLGAFTSAEKANSEWPVIAARFPSQLQTLSPRVVSVDTPSGRLFRLQAAARDEAQARAICDALRKQSQVCVPVIPH